MAQPLQASSHSHPVSHRPGRLGSADLLSSLPICTLLAQARLEDVFKSAQENMTQGPGSGRMISLALGTVAVTLLLVVLQQRRNQSAISKPVSHQGRLLKEILPNLALKKAEIKQLKDLAEEQSYSSPLLLVLCPSLLTKAMQAHTPAEREEMAGLLRKVTAAEPRDNA